VADYQHADRSHCRWLCCFETFGFASHCATVLLSLVLSMIGGAMGSRGTRRINRRFARHTVAPPPTTAAPEGPSSVLSRQN
jgi:hypothetical protein